MRPTGAAWDPISISMMCSWCRDLGRRRWQVDGPCDAGTALLRMTSCACCARLNPVEEWILEPGDILYLPPRIAHDGGRGGRSLHDLFDRLSCPVAGRIAGELAGTSFALPEDDDRYADPDLARQVNPGEISASALDRLHAMVAEAGNRSEFAQWFGEYSSTPKYPETDWRPEEPVGIERCPGHAGRGRSAPP